MASGYSLDIGDREMLLIANDIMRGILTTTFAFVKGDIRRIYGGSWQALWQSDTVTKVKP